MEVGPAVLVKPLAVLVGPSVLVEMAVTWQW